MAFDREGGHEVAQVAHQIRAAIHSLLHHGSPEQLADGQGLLEDTRRELYLILAGPPEVEGAEWASDTVERGTPATDESAETTPPPEIG